MPSQKNQLLRRIRLVNNDGETLVVRIINGLKALTDPIQGGLSVIVPTGRRADLVCFCLLGHDCHRGRDSQTLTSKYGNEFCFADLVSPRIYVLLQDLAEGQIVDILPNIDEAAMYAVVPVPAPALSAHEAANRPEYVFA